jgi:intracellular multiplication protein IcmQ
MKVVDPNSNPSLSGNLRNELVRRHLLEKIISEKAHFLETAESFYQKDAHNNDSYLVFCEEIIETIDRILEASQGDENSLFLRNTIKPLKRMREQALSLVDEISKQTPQSTAELPKISADMEIVYISIFQNDGLNLAKWELQLRSLPRYIIGRSVYQKEKYVQQLLRQKTLKKSCEAYVVIAVKKAALKSAANESPLLDGNGNPLTTLADGSVNTKNIVEFVHEGKRYHFLDGKLVPQ